ncbi:MAG: efflux RND transporter periplasmic adaptor subunit [Saprospiraceae bacterium]|nr:efflux RND transporter periplasmic adaptor subunit [Saprospiraceae bacterium]
MRVLILILTTAFIISCGSNDKPVATGAAAIEQKAKELADLKKQHDDIQIKIAKAEAELAKLDPSKAIKSKLVSTVELTTQGFQHYIDLQGSVKSENVSYVAPRNGMGGYVKSIYIKEGQFVKKGQLILKLDDQVMRQSIEATKTQLAFAQNVYDRTKGLWDQNIGTEVQLLSAKNNVEALKNQISVQEEQLKTFVVYADQNGIADIVNIKVGELFTGMSVTGPQIQIINNSELAVKVDVPENYASKVKQGAKVKVEIPGIGKTFETTISRISQSINAGSRGFTAECRIPASANAKPNMGASVKILDHSSSKAIVIPVNIVQSDEKGKYVYVMVAGKDGRMVTHKKTVTIGELYGSDVEILSGLAAGDKLIIQGYQNLYEGQYIENKQ